MSNFLGDALVAHNGDRRPATLIDVVIVFCTTINVGLFLFYLGIR